MKKFEIEFSGEDGSEMYKVSVFDGYVRADSLHIADYKKSSNGHKFFYSVRLRGEVADLPTICYSLRTVAETALTAYLLKGGVLTPINQEKESALTAYAVVIYWGDGSKSYLNEGDSLHTYYIGNKAARLFRTQEEAEFAGKIQILRNSHQRTEVVPIIIY